MQGPLYFAVDVVDSDDCVRGLQFEHCTKGFAVVELYKGYMVAALREGL